MDVPAVGSTGYILLLFLTRENKLLLFFYHSRQFLNISA